MKFKDYQAQKKANEDAQHRRREEMRPLHETEEKLRKSIEREWSLGPPTHSDSGRPGCKVIVQYGGFGYEIKVGVLDPSIGGVHVMELRERYLLLSPPQWHAFAEIVAVINLWKGGNLDELPPSGDWKVPARHVD